MGGFCVYGQSMEVARKRAEKKVPEFEPGTRRMLTPVEWKECVDKEAVDIFARMKPVRVSGEFDAPPVRTRLHRHRCAHVAVRKHGRHENREKA